MTDTNTTKIIKTWWMNVLINRKWYGVFMMKQKYGMCSLYQI